MSCSDQAMHAAHRSAALALFERDVEASVSGTML
jgi:hypothetical protein